MLQCIFKIADIIGDFLRSLKLYEFHENTENISRAFVKVLITYLNLILEMYFSYVDRPFVFLNIFIY